MSVVYLVYLLLEIFCFYIIVRAPLPLSTTEIALMKYPKKGAADSVSVKKRKKKSAPAQFPSTGALAFPSLFATSYYMVGTPRRLCSASPARYIPAERT